MAKTDISTAPQKMYKLLKSFSAEERQRVINSTLTLFGEVHTGGGAPGGGSGAGAGGSTGTGSPGGTTPTVRQFFDAKQPKGKIEELAVAARYREQYSGGTSNTKEEFQETFKAAKRNFDAKNFRRDIGNAKTAKLFNAGKDNILSHHGESYVDTLPDRQAAAALRKAGRGRKKGGRKKKTS
jgi:hypothetical protein